MMLLKQDNLWVSVKNADPAALSTITNILTFKFKTDDGEVSQLYMHPEHHKFPVGLLNFVTSKLTLDYEFVKDPESPSVDIKPDILSGIELRDYQVDAAKSAVANKNGIIKVATGGGKTEIYCAIVRCLGLNSMIISGQVNHSEQLCDRMLSRGLEASVLGGGKFKDTKHICAVSDSVYSGIKRNDKKILDILSKVEILVFDETQHLGCYTWQSIAYNIPNSRYRFGLSATPLDDEDDPYSNKHDVDLISMTGEVICNISAEGLIERGYLSEADVNIVPVKSRGLNPHEDNWHRIRDQGIIYNTNRCRVLRNLVYNLSRSKNKKILVLMQWHDQAYILLEDTHKLGLKGVYVSGGSSVTRYVGDSMVTYPESNKIYNEKLRLGEIDFLIGSSIYNEAEDIPCVTDLIIASAGRDSRSVIQKVGRSLRISEFGDVNIWDLYDSHHWMLMNQSNSRISVYESLGKGIRVVRSDFADMVKDPES